MSALDSVCPALFLAGLAAQHPHILEYPDSREQSMAAHSGFFFQQGTVDLLGHLFSWLIRLIILLPLLCIKIQATKMIRVCAFSQQPSRRSAWPYASLGEVCLC